MTIKELFKDKKIRTFFRWLKNEGCYQFYIKEVIQYYEKNRSYYSYADVIEYISQCCIQTIIDSTFYWRGTPQGQSFWSEKNYLWESYCLKNHIH